MKKLIYLSALACILSLPSCAPDDPIPEVTTTMELNFTGTFGEELLLMLKDYEYADGKKIRFNNFNFFVSNIALISSTVDESKTEMVEIERIDLAFDENNMALAQSGITLTIKDLPVGTYSGFDIGFGVPADLNNTRPADYGTGHPLKKNHWSDWNSYIFSIIEGGYDINGDGEVLIGGAETEGFTYHSGTNDVYNQGFIGRSIELKANEVTRLNLKIDVKALFKNNNPTYDTNNDGYLDIELFRGTHSDVQMELAKQIMLNFNTAVSI